MEDLDKSDDGLLHLETNSPNSTTIEVCQAKITANPLLNSCVLQLWFCCIYCFIFMCWERSSGYFVSIFYHVIVSNGAIFHLVLHKTRHFTTQAKIHVSCYVFIHTNLLKVVNKKCILRILRIIFVTRPFLCWNSEKLVSN